MRMVNRGWPLVLALFLITGTASAMVVAPITSTEGQRLLDEAIRFATVEWGTDDEARIGVPYRWGGRIQLSDFLAAVEANHDSTGLGVDASGLVIAVSRSIAPDYRFLVPRGDGLVAAENVNSALLFQHNVIPIEVGDLAPGDLIFFSGANGTIDGVGIYERTVGRNIRFVVASANSGRVVQTSVSLDGEYWATRFAGAGRLLRSGANE